MPLVRREHPLEGGWILGIVENFAAGEKLTLTADQIDESESPLARNVYFNKGRVRADTGYAQFADSGIWGNPRILVDFVKSNSTRELVLITNESVFTYNSTNSEWEPIKGHVSSGSYGDTTLDANEASGQTEISVADTTGFAGTDRVAIRLNDGTVHKSTVASVSAGVSITIDDALPSAADSGNAAWEPIELSGSDDKPHDYVNIIFKDWLVFTNGVDRVQRYDGTDVDQVPNMPNSGNTVCRTVALFKEYLFLGFTTEGGTARPFRIRWSDTADPEEWVTGNAGFQDLTDEPSDIHYMHKLGAYMAVYKDKSIIRGEYIGTADNLFDWPTAVAEDGAIGPEGIVPAGDRHFFIGHKSIWQYTGGLSIRNMGSNVFEAIFGVDGDLETSKRKRLRAFFVEERSEAWFIYPPRGSDYATRCRRLNINTGAWARRDFADNITAIGLYEKADSISWSELVGSWSAQDWTWDSRTTSSEAPIILLGVEGGGTPLIHSYDYLQTQDGGIAINFEFRTKKWDSIDRKLRFDEFNFFVKGDSVQIDYTIDDGTSWMTLDTLTPGAVFTRQRVHKQFVAPSLQLRFKGSGADFGLGWFSMKYREESGW